MTCKKQNGFTLVELLVVISILSILATVSVVGYTAFIEKARVSNDNDLVGQLNTYIEAHKVGSTTPIGEKEIIDIMKHKDFDDIKIQSNKDGYDIYFNTLTEKFELLKLEDAKDKENLIPSDEWMNNANGNGTGNEGESTGTGVPDISGDPENPTDSSQPTEPTTPPEVDEPIPELIITLSVFEQDKDDKGNASDTYVYSDGESIYVGININDESLDFNFATLNLSEIFITENCSVTECAIIEPEMEIPGYYKDKGITDRFEEVDGKINFKVPGDYQLSVIATSDDGIETNTILVDIIVRNVGMTTDEVNINVSQMKPEIILNGDSFKLQLMEGIEIIEPCTESEYNSYLWNEYLVKSKREDLYYSRMQVEIYINGNIVEYELSIDNDTNYYAIIDSISSDKVETCIIVYNYQTLNGNWVQKTVGVTVE